jgi:hypothetical protein
MADLMANADLAIGAGGISTYERLYLRLPAILKATSFNQLEPLTYMSSIGLFELFESSKELEQKLETALLRDNVSPPDCVENGNAKLITYMMSKREDLLLHLVVHLRVMHLQQRAQLEYIFLQIEEGLIRCTDLELYSTNIVLVKVVVGRLVDITIKMAKCIMYSLLS